DKGGVAVMFMALRAMQKAGTLKDANIEVVLTGDEESAGSPTSISRADLIAAGKRADVALDFEGLAVVDGEDYGDFNEMTDVLMGSTYFASHLPSPTYRPIFGVLWDMIGDKDLVIKKEVNSVQQAPEVVTKVWNTAKDLGHDDVFVEQMTPYAITDDHVPLLKAGLRVIDVIDLDYCCHHKPTDTIDKISAKSLSIVGDVAEALLR
ncbi:MAG: M20/M25/M40 family metallo-hydrolase, partial [Gemmatimonadaceae bacterium]